MSARHADDLEQVLESERVRARPRRPRHLVQLQQLWTHSTFGWPEQTPELAYYYPTSTLVTSRDIITLWVARMVIAGLYNLGEVPFRDVYITPKMLDGFGEGMSKSKGNGVDPLDIIDLYGADALRFQMVSIAGETQDCRLPVANVCPHCGKVNPVKQEHMYMRTQEAHVYDTARSRSAPAARGRTTTRSCRPPSRAPSASRSAATSPTSCGTPPGSSS